MARKKIGKVVPELEDVMYGDNYEIYQPEIPETSVTRRPRIEPEIIVPVVLPRVEPEIINPHQPDVIYQPDEPEILLPDPREKKEPNINPGTGPIVLPKEKKYPVSFDNEIKGLPIKIKCTWANCFTQPVWDRGLCIRSYDAKILKSYNDITNVIGTTTGNYYAPEGGKVWLEANLKFCDRMAIGWFRESDIWHTKNGEPNPNPEDDKKKTNWLTWLITGASILKIIS